VSSHNLLLDTGPFVVLVVGSVNPDLLGSVQHLKQFEPESLLVLESFVSRFRSISITPHVATETSYFLKKIGGASGNRVVAKFVEVLQWIQERNVPSRAAAARAEFAWLDLADCSLLEGGRADDTLLSTDAVLVNRRVERGFPAVHFNHLREQPGLL
jgi:hypothetical protein